MAGAQNMCGGGKHLVWSGNARGMFGFSPSVQGFLCIVMFEMGMREMSFLKLQAKCCVCLHVSGAVTPQPLHTSLKPLLQEM